jgi:hypothetical protein
MDRRASKRKWREISVTPRKNCFQIGKRRPRGLKPASLCGDLTRPGTAALPRSRKQPANSQQGNSPTFRTVLRTAEEPPPAPQWKNRGMQHRGRAALQRRVQRPKESGLQPQWTFWDLAAPRPGRARRQSRRKRTRNGTRRHRTRKPQRTHAIPWKSGASAPRPAPQKQPGFRPRGRFGIWQRHDREEHDFSRAARFPKKWNRVAPVELSTDRAPAGGQRFEGPITPKRRG